MKLQSAPNFRDLADLTNGDALRFRRGHLFRSELLLSLSETDRQKITSLGIRDICDLRSRVERDKEPSDLCALDGINVISESVDGAPLAGANLLKVLHRIEHVSPDKIESMMCDTYRTMPLAFESHLRIVLQRLAAPGHGATLIHCTAGKDRTGFVCALLLHALGFGWAAIMSDYMATARFYPLGRLLQRLEHAIGHPLSDRARLAAVGLVEVKPAYLLASFDEIERAHGSIEIYLHRQLGLDAALRLRLQQRLLEG
jgi:protein-tyrosine phosphatase